MLYSHDDSKSARIIKHIIFWTSLFFMFGLFIFIVFDENKMPQRQVRIEIDVKNKVNICLPDEKDKSFEKSFFDF